MYKSHVVICFQLEKLLFLFEVQFSARLLLASEYRMWRFRRRGRAVVLEDSEGGRERERERGETSCRNFVTNMYKEERVITGISRIFTSAC